jgi:hypothetical protein
MQPTERQLPVINSTLGCAQHTNIGGPAVGIPHDMFENEISISISLGTSTGTA